MFDAERRRLVSAFEEMHKPKRCEGFDSWYQDDVRQLSKQVSLATLSNYNFRGCLTSAAARARLRAGSRDQTTRSSPWDISETALRVRGRTRASISARPTPRSLL